MLFLSSELRILSFPSNQFNGQMPEGDGDEMLCHLKARNVDLGNILAKVSILYTNGKMVNRKKITDDAARLIKNKNLF